MKSTSMHTDPATPSAADLDDETLLTEVGASFQSEKIRNKVRWHISVLRKVSGQPELEDISAGLRNRLTQIFTSGSDEAKILQNLKNLTTIESADGKSIELRRFLKHSGRILDELKYRKQLGKKAKNTQYQIDSMMLVFPDSRNTLLELGKQTKALINSIQNESTAITHIKKQEEKLQNAAPFAHYEALKTRFLKDWLGRFFPSGTAELAGKSPEEIQQMVIEHRRHQMTALLKSKVKPSKIDISEHLGLHDTLEGSYSDTAFWSADNLKIKKSFRELVLDVIRTFGMIRGKRYAFFESETDNQYLLFGLGIDKLGNEHNPIEMVPYIKPFTKKGGYLLEVRKREITDSDQYYYELRHYVLPFFFALDSLPNFKVNPDLIRFFTSNY